MRSGWVVSLLGCLWFCLSCNSERVPNVLYDKSDTLNINGSGVFIRNYAFLTEDEKIDDREPLLIVHGGPVMDHSYFLPYLDELAKAYRLVFYDQRACGRSSVAIDSASMSLDGFVEDIELLRKELKLEKVNLLGHSWGGLLAMKYGIKYSQHLDKLVLSSSMAPSSADWQTENQMIGARVTNKDIKAREAIMNSGALQSDDPREAVRSLLKQSFKYQMYDTANLKKLDLFVPKDYLKRSGVFALLSPDLNGYDLYKDLDKISCPTLLVYGETEHATRIYTDKMLNRIKSASLKLVAESGHFPFVEQPETYNNIVLEFLNQ